jgi:hypothetical protein
MVVFQSGRFQTWAAQKVAHRISEALGAKVAIRSIKIRFFDRALIEGFYVEDLHHDTLLYVDQVEANFDDVYLNFTHFDFDHVKLKNGQFNVRQFEGEEDLNIQFILDAINGKSNPLDTVKKTPPELFFWDIDVEGLNFTYEYRDTIPDTGYGINYDHLQIRDISAHLNRLLIIDDSLTGEIRNMRCREASGFVVNEFNTDFVISYTLMDFMSLDVKTPRSQFKGNAHFDYKNYGELSDFITKVPMRARLNSSSINLDELSYFAPELRGLNQQVSITGDIKGTVDHLKGKNVFLEYGKKSRFAGSFQFDGLPEIDQTHFNFNIVELRTCKADLEQIQQYPFQSGTLIQLPDLVQKLGVITYRGKFNGMIDNLAAEGSFLTDVGDVLTDLGLRFDKEINDYVYDGFISTHGFNLGKLVTLNPLVGAIVGDAVINGSSFNSDKLSGTIKGSIQKIQLNDYDYQNITIDGEASKNVYNGKLKIEDPALRMDFSGLADFSSASPVFDFRSNVGRLDFTALKLIKRDSSLIVSTQIASNFTGKNIDDLIGEIELSETVLHYGAKKFNVDDLLLEASGTPKSRSIHLYSDLADAEVKGAFQVADLPVAVMSCLNGFLPSYTRFDVSSKEIFEQNFTYNVKVKDSRLLSALFFPSIELSAGSEASGNLRSGNQLLSFKSQIPSVQVNGLKLEQVVTHAEISSGKLTFSSDVASLLVTDSIKIEHVNLTANAITDSLDLSLNWASKRNLGKSDAQINSRAVFKGSRIEMNVLPSLILIEDTLWQVNEDNSILFDKDRVEFENLSFIHQKEFIRIDGLISSNSDDELDVILDNFQLNNLNPFISQTGISLQGSTQGIISFADLKSKAYFKSNLNFKNIELNNDLIGDAQLSSKWDPVSDRVMLNGLIGSVDLPKLSFLGFYIPSKKENNLDLQLAINNFRLELFKKYVSDLFSDVKGLADGSVHLTGSPDKPILDGFISFKRTFMKVDILNTEYGMVDKVYFSKNLIYAKNVVLQDSRLNSGRLDLKVTHNYFSDFHIDVKIQAENLQALNTTESMNDLFYGSAYVTGKFHAYGPISNIKMDIDAKTERGTLFNVPLSGTGDVSQQDFVTFVKREAFKKQNKIKKRVSESRGYELNFNLEITPEAETFLLFDPKVGDIIKGNGNANLRIEVTEAGEFNMYGDYLINDGDYLFTLQNVINKKFVVQKGGVISFKGDPFDADINLTANYRVRTSLYNLVKGVDSSAAVKRIIDVDAVMYLTDKLMKPNVRFDIRLPNSDDQARNLLKSQIINDDELNKQVFALILFRNFITPQGGASETVSLSGVGGANASELLSSQLSNMLSQFSNDVSIGVNYRQGNATSKDQVSVNLSTQFFNDRLSVDGNVGNKGTQNAQNTSNVVGEFNLEVRITEDGAIRIKVFNRSNQYLLVTNDVPYTQGVGLFYRKEVNEFDDFFKAKKKD